jgi:hypothetical protein
VWTSSATERYPVKVTMLLADAAQASEGKLYVLGGGWSIRAAEPSPMALALKIDVPWDQANRPHTWSVELLSEDGQPVQVETPDGGQPIRIEGSFEVGRPPGIREGASLDVPMAVSMAPFPLDGGRGFVWQLWVDGETRDEWRVSFSTRPVAG